MSEDAFSRLDPDLPLTLLPVRLEARYLPRDEPTHLLVRIFPDVIHADGHRRALSAREATAGRQFWKSIWGQTDAAAITEARRWLAAQTGPHRALWVSTSTRPTNLDTGDAEPVFPELTPEEGTEPVVARLLPDEWMVRLYDADMALAHTAFSRAVRADPAMAPTLSGGKPDADHPITGKPLSAPEAFLYGQELLWTTDFDLAELIGMAVRIPIADVPETVGALVVLGVRADRNSLEEGRAIDDLLEAQWYTRGLDLVPQGTPTNNTDAGRSQVSLSDPDVDELFEREASERLIPPLGRAAAIALDPATMYWLPSADSASLAFGRIWANALDRAVHADWGEGAAAKAMNLAIGYAVFGRYMSGPFAKLDGSGVAGEFTETFRQWFVDWVRGAGPLPVLRIGEQPYGLLPITTRPANNFGAMEFKEILEHRLTEFSSYWKEALPVAALDPDATDGLPGGGSESDALVVADVLAAVPHPTAFRLRGATDHLPVDMARFDELIELLEIYINNDKETARTWPAQPLDSLIWEYWWESRKQWVTGTAADRSDVPSASNQTFNLEMYRQEVDRAHDLANADGPQGPNYYPTEAYRIRPLIDDELMPLLEMHLDAGNAAPRVLWDWVDGAGLGSEDVVRLVGTTYDDVTEDVVDLIVTTDGDAAEIRDVIVQAIDLLDRATDNNTPPGSEDRQLVTAPSPLFWHLLDVTCRTVPTEDIGPVRLGFQVLLEMIDHPTVADPVGELERLMRETLGLAMHRLDAWVTSIASERLARKRRFGYGAQIGGYGWLLDLKKSEDPATQGFIHAHSLTHAATAAVLRSGWNAYGTASGETPLSVNLSSDRVRGGQWILDGVRNGQDLAELLGARFERYLHDAELDVWIESVRSAALAAIGSTRPPNAVVDGLLVARAASDVAHTEREAALWSDLDDKLNALSKGDPGTASKIRQALDAIAADLDSVADLTMAQSVHTILQGNPDASAAMLAVTGGGDGAVPPVTVTATQRDGRLVSHRVVAIWHGTAKTDPAEARPLVHLVEPRLIDWLEGQLPKPDRVVADVTVRNADGDIIGTNRTALDALGLTGCEAALLAGTREDQDRSRLGRVLAAAAARSAGAGTTVEVDFAASSSQADGWLSVNEFGLISAALVNALGRCRALRADDLVLPGIDPGPPEISLRELEGRVSAAESAIEGMIGDLSRSDPERRLRALHQAAVIKVAGAVAALEAGADDDSMKRIITVLKNRLLPGDPPGDPIQAALQRLKALSGATVPILPVFMPPADPERSASALSSTRRRQAAMDGHRWLRQCGRVRADLGSMTDWLLLSETTLGRPAGPLGLAQLPESGGPWAAVDEPSGEGNRLSLLSLTGPDPLSLDGEMVAGLLVDSWTEAIPRRDQQTGIAVHFDAPTARPPQAVLLSVVEEDQGFDADEIADQLLHTVELAKQRAVAPGQVSELGHYLPAVFLPPDVGEQQ